MTSSPSTTLSTKHWRIRSDERTIIVGDVHGCLVELRQLLQRCQLQDTDRVAFVGDLVGKGPQSAAVVAFARELNALAVCGNHDARWLQWYEARKACKEGTPGPALHESHVTEAQKITEADWTWLSSLPLSIQLEAFNTWIVHAGLIPGTPLENQNPIDLLTMRSIRADGTPSKHIDDGPAWASLWKGPAHVIFGHDAVRGLQQHPFATGIDSGCVYGKALSAYVLPERRILSVPANQIYCAPDTSRLI